MKGCCKFFDFNQLGSFIKARNSFSHITYFVVKNEKVIQRTCFADWKLRKKYNMIPAYFDMLGLIILFYEIKWISSLE